MTVKSPRNLEITLTFSADELAQIEAFSALHGVSTDEFIRDAARSAAQIKGETPSKVSSVASWMTETASSEELVRDLFAPEVSPPAKPQITNQKSAVTLSSSALSSSDSNPQTTPKSRSMAGVASTLARGSGPVWEIRQALGQERVHGLGWTREQLAFVLKMSVVGVRKMEHLGKTPNKSLEARRSLLTLAQTLQHPTPAITVFVAGETAALASLR